MFSSYSQQTSRSVQHSLRAALLVAAGFFHCSAAAAEVTLHGAARLGDLAAVQQLTAAGSDLDSRNDYGSTPLTIAVTFGQPQVVQLLLDHGADINLAGGGGSAPLHLAAFFGRTELVKLLLAAGADQAQGNANDATAHQVAAAPFADDLPVYDAMARALAPLGVTLDYRLIAAERLKIAEILSQPE